jgi:hypothetical protein
MTPTGTQWVVGGTGALETGEVRVGSVGQEGIPSLVVVAVAGVVRVVVVATHVVGGMKREMGMARPLEGSSTVIMGVGLQHMGLQVLVAITGMVDMLQMMMRGVWTVGCFLGRCPPGMT